MRIEIASDQNYFFIFYFFISIEEWIKNSLVNVFLLSKNAMTYLNLIFFIFR